ncbi:hypothetical protein RBB79_15560 [Tunturiibacter empetritectus]|uniref:Uncharacterized protein n=1 Tax=Tunturiibacter lichenicola TaxID=2051959 RepID=A0A852VDT1_9BACT|nr:hypothetical protein [Edaphobacter lichenicola]NYF91033.1 hypothetical protein [Edaphobacter lichenicola]
MEIQTQGEEGCVEVEGSGLKCHKNLLMKMCTGIGCSRLKKVSVQIHFSVNLKFGESGSSYASIDLWLVGILNLDAALIDCA